MLSLLFISCSKDEESYTISGKFLNGTTNIPYENVKIEISKVIGPAGFSKSTYLGDVYTNSNGEFSFDYKVMKSENGTLHLVFGRNGLSDMLTKSGLPLSKNSNLNFYLSDSCRSIFSFSSNNPLIENEVIKVYSYNQAFDTLVFNNIELANSNFKFSLRTQKMFGAVGVMRVRPDTTISIFNPTFEMEGDPIINNITINY